MWLLVVFEIIICIFMGISSKLCFDQVKKETDEEKKKGKKAAAWCCLIFTLALTSYTLFSVIPNAVQVANLESVSVSTTTNYNSKEKCSWCGKMVSKSNMKGSWCKDCQNNAFGKDGWYNK